MPHCAGKAKGKVTGACNAKVRGDPDGLFSSSSSFVLDRIAFPFSEDENDARYLALRREGTNPQGPPRHFAELRISRIVRTKESPGRAWESPSCRNSGAPSHYTVYFGCRGPLSFAAMLLAAPERIRISQQQGVRGGRVRRGAQIASRFSRILKMASRLGGVLAFMSLAALAHSQSSVTLAWDPSPDASVVGYHLYVGAASQVYTQVIDAGNLTTKAVSSLSAGVTYYFALTAYDGSGLESAFSEEISYTIPLLPLPRLQIPVLRDGQFQIQVTGEIGHAYVVLATEDLRNWSVIGLVTIGLSGVAEFVDNGAASYPKRFYRLRGI
jgi:hypothetical protein